MRLRTISGARIGIVRALIISMLCLTCIGAELTLRMEPTIRFRVDAGHSYTLYGRDSMLDPWQVISNVPTNSGKSYDITYKFPIVDQGPEHFYWVQRDDEIPTTPIPTNTVTSTNTPPPLPTP